MNIVSNCPLCEEHSLHILGEDKTETQQCINCGYVTAEKFKLNGLTKEEHKEFKNLTEDMREWAKESNDRLWIPTIMTLPIGMLYPKDVDNLVNHTTEMRWHFAPMIDIPEEERKNYPVEGDTNKFYKVKIDTDNSLQFDSFMEGMLHVNEKIKAMSEPPKPIGLNLPKLKKIDLDK